MASVGQIVVAPRSLIPSDTGLQALIYMGSLLAVQFSVSLFCLFVTYGIFTMLQQKKDVQRQSAVFKVAKVALTKKRHQKITEEDEHLGISPPTPPAPAPDLSMPTGAQKRKRLVIEEDSERPERPFEYIQYQ